MRINDIPQIAALSLTEKIMLIEDFWDEISKNDLNIPVPESHRKELNSRLDRYNSNPEKLLSLDELKSRINNRK